jgi:hypothetical protein
MDEWMSWIRNYFSSLLYTGCRESFIGVWDQCTMNIVSCSGLEGRWLCRGRLFFFVVWVGCETGVLKIAFPYPSVRLTNKQVILVTQPHKLVQTYILFTLLGWSLFILSLYWEIVRDVRGNQIITTDSCRIWEQTKHFKQNMQPPAGIVPGTYWMWIRRIQHLQCEIWCAYCIADEDSFKFSWIWRRVDWCIQVTSILEVPAASIFISVAICQSTYLHMPEELNFLPDTTCWQENT